MIDLEYIEIGGLLYPNIQLDDAEIYNDLGKYGKQRLNYLHEQKPQQYRELLFTGKLAQHCAEIEQAAFEVAEGVRGQHDFLRSTGRYHFVRVISLLSQSGSKWSDTVNCS